MRRNTRSLVLSEEDWVRDRIALAMGGFTHFEFLRCAAKLDLFGVLQQKPGASLATIARALKIPLNSARVLTMGCCNLGVLKRKRNGYFNSHFADLFTAQSHPNLLAQMEAHHALIYRPMHRLLESLVHGTNVGLQEVSPRGKGRTLYDRLSKNRKMEKVFHAWMNSVGNSGLGEIVIDQLRPYLGKVSQLVDYGGGDGTNAIRLCRSFPHLDVSVFDLPSVCQLAGKKIRVEGLADRIRVVPGNFLRDPFLRPVEAILFSHVTNIYSNEANLELIRKSYRALKPGGLLILFDSIYIENQSAQSAGPFLSAYFLGLATGQGMVYSLDDYEAWLKKARFRKIAKFPFSSGHALIVARK